jgi:phenylacetate-CoA ligase
MHTHSDWLILEPVGADYRPTAPGQQSFPGRDGESVRIAPMAFETVIERTPDVDLFQIVQTVPTTLRVRIPPTAGADPDRVWSLVRTEIAGLLTAHQVGHCIVETCPRAAPAIPGGKCRVVIPLA